MPRTTMHSLRKVISKVNLGLFKSVWSRLRPRRFVSLEAMFDRDWYLKTYPDVAAAGIDPVRHYEKYGAAEGRDPSPNFNTRWYLETYPDVAASGINPLRHYLVNGQFEGRATRAKLSLSPLGPSNEAKAAAWDVIQTFSHVEPDLANLDKGALSKRPIADSLERPLAEAWRKLYLSMSSIPQCLVVVPTLDDGCTQRLVAGVVNHVTRYGNLTDLLVLAADETVPSIASSLPMGTPWRSIAEFQPGLTLQKQSRVLTTLIHTLRPDSVMVIDSGAGLDVLSRYGNTMQNYSRLFAVASLIGHQTDNDFHLEQVRQLAKYLKTLYVVNDLKQVEILASESHRISEYCPVQILPQTVSDEELSSILMREYGLFDKTRRNTCG